MKKVRSNIGYSYWKKANKIIPGGNSILSKRPERYLGKLWPTYYKKAKGCFLWDLQGKKYIDMAQMGIGSAILGYSNDKINFAVKNAIKDGVNTTLNSLEEYNLAKKLLKINKGFGGVKFCRSGGEAMDVAIRIARSFTRKQKIAFSGYHGWFDWYLATNLKNKANLNDHLLEGLSPTGVYNGLKNSIHPFKYDDPDDLIRTIKKNKDIGIVVVESARYNYPNRDFVNTINKICNKRNIILICDEITSGFRINNSGAYKSVGFKPQIVVFGKGLGNGFAISAVVGKSKIMKNSIGSFISSSNWSERLGFVAALSTIDFIQKKKVWKHLNDMGKLISKGWKDIFKELNLNISVSNFYPLVTMKPNYGQFNNVILTYFMQDMLRKGYIVSSSIYLSYAHDKRICLDYLKEARKTFMKISDLIKQNRLKRELRTEIRTDSFQRL